MNINTSIKITPKELASSLCDTSTRNELFQLITEIEYNVCDYRFTEKLFNYLKEIIDNNSVDDEDLNESKFTSLFNDRDNTNQGEYQMRLGDTYEERHENFMKGIDKYGNKL